MFELLYVNGHIEVMQNNTSVARIFPYNNYCLVKIFSTGYDFTCGDVETALKTIEMKMESEKIEVK